MHWVATGQRLQTSFAFAIWESAGPEFPTGKNSSGSSSRHTASWRQSMVNAPNYFLKDSGFTRCAQATQKCSWFVPRGGESVGIRFASLDRDIYLALTSGLPKVRNC